ncbi:MAG: hypothetical protein RSB63_10775 [Enterococcus sp.]|uniref:hypothetical protein n=1 Tax=Enterococcus TaxID=1350 RepID=UPI002FCB7DFC
MKTIYKIFEVKDGDGKWFEKYDVSDNFPMEYPYIKLAPPTDLINPRYIFGTGWVEDEEALLEGLKQENKELKDRLNMTEGALLDLADQLLSVKGGVG